MFNLKSLSLEVIVFAILVLPAQAQYNPPQGDNEMVQIYEAIDRLVQYEMYNTAADLYLQLKDYDGAVYCYEMAGRIDEALKIAKEKNDPIIIIGIYERAEQYQEAIKIAKEAGLRWKLVDLYEKGRFIEEAIEEAKKLDDRLTINVYKRAGRLAEAARHIEKMGNKQKDDDLKWQYYEEAIELYLQVRYYDSAVDLYKKMDNYKQAVDTYYGEGWPHGAARVIKEWIIKKQNKEIVKSDID